MLDRLVREIKRIARVQEIILVAEAVASGWEGRWIADLGRGLNEELIAASHQLGRSPLLVIHTDLPLIAAADLEALLLAAEQTGCAIAPDRHGYGTNAVAIADGRDFTFGFGPGSFARHLAGAGPSTAIVERRGLAIDCDTPDDLDLVLRLGFSDPGQWQLAALL